ncbi:MAG: aldehyde dehydrogenase, partial [Pedosphaera sp.]|nr:aldehyde dehydrogenase [Pedosphaera sp.]
MRTYQNFIAGEWVAARSGKTFQNSNPADTREAVAQYPLSAGEDVLAAIAAAQ